MLNYGRFTSQTLQSSVKGGVGSDVIMEERRIYHVKEAAEHRWQVVREGFHRPHLVRPQKEEAILLAKRLAKLSACGEVMIHDVDDRVERHLSYRFPAPQLRADEP